MQNDGFGTYQDEEQGEPTGSSMGLLRKSDKEGKHSLPENAVSQSELEAVNDWLLNKVAADLRHQTDHLTSRMAEHQTAVLRAVADLNKRLDAVARDVQLILDALRNQGVRNAIDSGHTTSDIHRRHLELAQSYSGLMQQDVRHLVKLLCPQQTGEDDTALARRRAEIARKLVALLFEPLDQPLSGKPEQIVAELRELNLATDAPDFRTGFPTTFGKAARLRDAVVGLPITGELDSPVDVTALSADDYEPWPVKPAPGARPEFLIAPSYIMRGARPQTLTKPVVFVAPPPAPGTGR